MTCGRGNISASSRSSTRPHVLPMSCPKLGALSFFSPFLFRGGSSFGLMLRICCGGSCRLLMLPKVMFQRLGLDQGEGAKALLAQQDAQVCKKTPNKEPYYTQKRPIDIGIPQVCMPKNPLNPPSEPFKRALCRARQTERQRQRRKDC